MVWQIIAVASIVFLQRLGIGSGGRVLQEFVIHEGGIMVKAVQAPEETLEQQVGRIAGIIGSERFPTGNERL